MGVVAKLADGTNPCGKCGIPLTSATAEGREDGLYCDKCLTEIADKSGERNSILEEAAKACEAVARSTTQSFAARGARACAARIRMLKSVPELQS